MLPAWKQVEYGNSLRRFYNHKTNIILINKFKNTYKFQNQEIHGLSQNRARKIVAHPAPQLNPKYPSTMPPNWTPSIPLIYPPTEPKSPL